MKEMKARLARWEARFLEELLGNYHILLIQMSSGEMIQSDFMVIYM
jgi:hypothetical protein